MTSVIEQRSDEARRDHIGSRQIRMSGCYFLVIGSGNRLVRAVSLRTHDGECMRECGRTVGVRSRRSRC